MNGTVRPPHPAETKHEVKGRIRTCRPARRDTREPSGPDHERDPDWNLVRGED
ncbi:hypothetical protein GTY65_22830 [Streptomyces sp. SID8379]|uniref:hypothetical protein n=1 Tax=unclassified Streptomyces TaxID=2593676 RepID=UPI000361858D|nr:MULTISPECIES: hypothetical protein [unclassified Streptomyces]MYW66880.1 hypothetical protein [Streptomyces sp. SID8379]